jgi:CRISPR-associated protein Csc1
MIIYHCVLTLHDSLFFATREMGRLYETEPVLHNYALSYALGLAVAPYFTAVQVPTYQADLRPLTPGVYITPARALQAAFLIATFKYGNNHYHMKMEQATRNVPSFGRAKEVAAESRFEFYALSGEPRAWPGWVRLGKWMSKAALAWEVLAASRHEGEYAPACPLNPLDLPPTATPLVYDLIAMPPSSLLANAVLRGPHWKGQDAHNVEFTLPADLGYFAAVGG